ncbi:20291_t:CDS:1 [Racocetra persica]|uniref:20291_t:CDS:1 n=1 Tax=Racocetra persica TaxID=160502 RepID=A0ACA9QFF0_9GLOM|nr:20291_t:CDS:1 [Racocetra persica]
MNFSSKKIENLQELIDKIRNENKLLLKEKDECEKTDLTNKQIIDENKNLKEKDFEKKISEIMVEISNANRELGGFLKSNNLEKEKTHIDESLDNFKIIYNKTDLLETKMDLIVEFSETINNNIVYNNK